jgi:hypothetical protein
MLTMSPRATIASFKDLVQLLGQFLTHRRFAGFRLLGAQLSLLCS